MDKDRIVGALKRAKGSVEEAAGKLIGDAELEAKGKADKIEGSVQNAVGGLKDALTPDAPAIFDKDRVGGALRHAKGTVEEAAGRLAGDAKLEAEGKADKVVGSVQSATAAVKAAVAPKT